MYLSFMGTVIVIFTVTSLAVLCVASASSLSASSSLDEEGSMRLAPVKRGIDPVGSWLIKKRPGSSPSDVYGSQSHNNWQPIGGSTAQLAARRISEQDEEEFEQGEEQDGGPVKRRIDPVGSYLLRKRVIDPVGSYLLKKKSDGYGSLQSGVNE